MISNIFQLEQCNAIKIKTLTDIHSTKDQSHLKPRSRGFLIKDIKKKVNDGELDETGLHSEEIKENLGNVNMDAWYYIYENYVNPTPKKYKV